MTEVPEVELGLFEEKKTHTTKKTPHTNKTHHQNPIIKKHKPQQNSSCKPG